MSKLILVKRAQYDDCGRRRHGGYVIKDDHIITNVTARKQDSEFIELSEIIDQHNKTEERIAAVVADLKAVLVRFNCCCNYCIQKAPHMGVCKGCGYINGYTEFKYKEKAENQDAQL